MEASQLFIPDCPLGPEMGKWFVRAMQAVIEADKEAEAENIHKLLSIKQTAEILAWKVGEDGRCRKLDMFLNTAYCNARGYQPLKYYFTGKNRQFELEDVKEFRKQFIHN